MKAIETALSLTQAYKLGIERFENMLGDEFSKAVKLMSKSSAHIIICGMGKSGLVGRKISSTLASTGTPSIFLHPAEAIHGDLGKVQKKSIVLLISYSGETGEIIALIPALKRLEVTIIALTGVKESTLASKSDIILDTSVDREACPLNLAPTTSSMITMVLGDALAVSLMEVKNFKQEDFALTHPGGSLGKRLLSSVKDEMKQNNLPFVEKQSTVQEVLVKMTEGRLGLALVGSKEKLHGVITDGDIRRALIDNNQFSQLKAIDLMNKNPLTAFESDNLQVAEKRMREAKVQCLVVKNNINEVVGVIQIFE
ncbi:KpsF/GutQ family sugar-phosphate isomerase [Alphaproteobacteria bacterium]|jgi:arabinose-5-phosphate isomerase|nr:KpsF/GutQ family sugar-phosphate isomerase [Alphaproteobacteria bacterium]MDB2388310.1 KpsF/GutQ family sugar-phosphate isomerase [Alphaproteobacteria bacterium]MDC3410148.1 KpsF/GutQ family sugar-phosphate isomerase [Alphaproteobacteria bacterium]